LAIRLAQSLSAEIISADSRQIFRELEIGTAKPSPSELTAVKHHLINHRSLQDEYDAGAFGRDAREIIDKVLTMQDVVLLCGGSGLYIKSVLEGFDALPVVSANVREEIIETYRAKGLVWLQQEVLKQDEVYFGIVDRQNPQRLMRALEIIRSTGKPFSDFHKKLPKHLPYNVVKIGLELDRAQLFDRIDRRLDDMIQRGLFEEAQKFFGQRQLNSLQTVGYQEIYGWMEGKYDREEAVRLMKRNSRHYAKRQMTWFKKDKEIKWFHPEDSNGITDFVALCTE
jgi:tRNA dimethylallyltransferase